MRFINPLVFILLLFVSVSAQAFPEIPFCPLGGPGGWLDRMFDDDDHRPPPWMMRPPHGYYTPHSAPPWYGNPYRYPSQPPGWYMPPPPG